MCIVSVWLGLGYRPTGQTNEMGHATIRRVKFRISRGEIRDERARSHARDLTSLTRPRTGEYAVLGQRGS